jgi:hypothetical protein
MPRRDHITVRENTKAESNPFEAVRGTEIDTEHETVRGSRTRR